MVTRVAPKDVFPCNYIEYNNFVIDSLNLFVALCEFNIFYFLSVRNSGHSRHYRSHKEKIEEMKITETTRSLFCLLKNKLYVDLLDLTFFFSRHRSSPSDLARSMNSLNSDLKPEAFQPFIARLLES